MSSSSKLPSGVWFSLCSLLQGMSLETMAWLLTLSRTSRTCHQSSSLSWWRTRNCWTFRHQVSTRHTLGWSWRLWPFQQACSPPLSSTSTRYSKRCSLWSQSWASRTEVSNCQHVKSSPLPTSFHSGRAWLWTYQTLGPLQHTSCTWI